MPLGSGLNRLGFLNPLVRAAERVRHRPAYGEQLVRSWARQVGAYEEVPEVYRSCFDRLPLPSLKPFPYAVLMPSLKRGYDLSEVGWLVLKLGPGIHILEDAGPAVRETHYPFEAIQFVERGSILLHAWLTIRALDTNGTVGSTTLRFNSVTEHLMLPFMEAIRAPTTAGSTADLTTERSRLDFLQSAHFKFHSYGRGSLRPGARVLQVVFQPEMRSEVFRLFGLSISRLKSPAHLVILTDSELILIRDDDTQRWSRGAPHGAIWTYVPRAKIIDGALACSDGGIQLLSVRLEGGAQIQLPFNSERRLEFERLVAQLQT